jgi:CheY-like chemotaxis protein
MCKQLSACGYTVHAANHGVEALKALKDAAVATTTTSPTTNGYFSIVLCDIEMPVINGIICVQNIRGPEHEGYYRDVFLWWQ